MKTDKCLIGNKRIEDAISEMYDNMSDEKLAKVFTVIRERIAEEGHLVVAVKAGANGVIELRPVKTSDGKQWFAAFTSFDEQMKMKSGVMSQFTVEIAKLFDMVLQSEEIDGIMINPWDKAIKLDKNMIRLIAGFEQ